MFCVSSVFLGIFPLHLFSKVWVNAIYNILLLCFSVFRDVSCCCSHLYESTVELVLGGLEGGGGGTNFRCQGRGIARTLPRGRASKQEEASPSPCLLAGSLHGPSLEEPNRRKTAHRDPPPPASESSGFGAERPQLNNQHILPPKHFQCPPERVQKNHLFPTSCLHSSPYSWDTLKLFGSRLLPKCSSFCFRNPYEQLWYNIHSHYHCPFRF